MLVMVGKRNKEGRALSAGLETYADAAGQKAEPIFLKVLREGEAPPDIATLLRQCSRIVDHNSARLHAAAEAHAAEVSDDVLVAKRVEEAGDQLFTTVVQCRQVGETVVGEDFSNRIGITGSTPCDFTLLAQGADTAAKNLREQTFEATIPGMSFDAAGWAERLQNASTELKSAQGAGDRERREASETLKARNEAMVAFDQALSGVSMIAKGLLLLTGDVELADSLKRYKRRSSAKGSDAATPPAKPADPA